MDTSHETHDLNKTELTHAHVVAAFASTCILLTVMLFA